MKGILKYLLIIFIINLCFFSPSFAKEGIESINIDIYINESGDATVTEVWDCEAYSGTEWYHPYYNLGNSKITNLSVSENGKEYTLIQNWNTGATQAYKKEKCGINDISNGVEICWGMGDYGKHKYQVKYTIENFVSELKDSQMIYWTLLPHNMSDRVDNASIKIYADKDFDNSVEVWGFGEDGGICRVNNGYIEMHSKNGKETSEYMTILAKLPVNFFNSTNNINKNFDYYYDMAIEGTSINKEVSADIFPYKLFMVGFIVVLIISVPLSYILAYIFSVIGKGLEKISKKIHPIFVIAFYIIFLFTFCRFYYDYDFGGILAFCIIAVIAAVIANILIKEHKVIKGKIRESDVDYYRDIPCNKDIFKAYYIAYQYGILKNETDLLGAVVLKWIKEGRANVIDKNNDSKNDCIELTFENYKGTWENKDEKELYQMMYEASGDGILEKKELKRWCGNKYSRLFKWFSNVMIHEQRKMVENGEIILIKKGKYEATDVLISEGKLICGLKKYLKDFSLIHEREAIEVHLFEDYLIMAQMLGIAKKVAKQFKELYPNVVEESSFNYNDYIFVNTISYGTMRMATHARTVKSMSSSGGGGSSFSGGGGGSFGGGSSGGGGRR